MKLIPFSPEYLRMDEALPFGLREANGRLLLAAGQHVPSTGRLLELQRQPLFAEESEAADWYRRLTAAVDQAMRKGQTLAEVAAVRPDAPPSREAAAPPPMAFHEQWDALVLQLDAALRAAAPESDWRSRVFSVHGRARQLIQRRPDASLYWLNYESIHGTERYSCRHALLVLSVCEPAAALLGWPQDRIDSLGRAALTMNVAMMKLQDLLAGSKLPPSAAMNADIARHPQAGADLLAAAGLDDPLCLEVVRLHHEALPGAQPLAERPPAHQLAELLRRVDVCTAKYSRRASREPMLPTLALREACLTADGRPDELAPVLLKTLGLYPPGCFVELVGGELAVVLARGKLATQPWVATLVAANGLPLGEPALRDTADARYAIKGPVQPQAVRVRPSHAKLLALR